MRTNVCGVLGLAGCHMDLIVHEKKCINYNANVYIHMHVSILFHVYASNYFIKNCIIYNNLRYFSLYANSILTCTNNNISISIDVSHSIIHVYVPELKHLI